MTNIFFIFLNSLGALTKAIKLAETI